MSTEAAKRSTTGALTMKQRRTDKLKPFWRLLQNPRNADMKDDMQKEAVNIAIPAFEKNNVEKDVAEYIKKEFDKKHGPIWNCIVGCNFGKPKFPLDSIFMENKEIQIRKLELLALIIMFEQHCNIENLGRVNKVKRTQKLSVSLTHLSRMGRRWHQCFIRIAAVSKHFRRGYVGIHSLGFRDFLLKPELLRSIVDSGFEHPSEGKVLNSCLMLTFVNSMN
ncbi:hypothetical protein CXB51_027537 [Gossypium anomalum]|uniref:Dynein light chain 1, cytoplasmic n=1 Tax=Gossypium anomalum TaxID=47600 RepID=A0A8J5Y5E1_9ROSI|nr:hypothetical protein CXB51_027537 [Gossypium anomalum]